ncbi:crystal protein-like [Arapaima gigas]
MKECNNIFLGFFTLGFVLFCVETTSVSDTSIAALLRNISSGLLSRDESIYSTFSSERHQLDPWTMGENLKSVDQSSLEDGPKVQTKNGAVRGVAVDKVYIFYGIPYASPPTGTLRWKPPTPVTPWPGVYDATVPRAACMQSCSGPISKECPGKVSEDCLYLNIFVPLDVNFSAPQLRPLPVMVWIHGGDFIAGTASKPLYDGRFISNFTHTVVVSLEYRLGAFGFLVSGKDPKTSAVGNYGILDQQAALLWVQQNIAAFGGDSNKVTIFGESAGAQSVGLHLMIQTSQPLFQQAVLQSLPFSIPLKTRHEALKLGKEFAKVANCSANDMVCLLSLSPQAILAAQIKACSKIVNPFRFLEMFEVWGPCIDGGLIKEQAVTAFQNGHWQREKPILLGTTSEEGVIFVYGVFSKPVTVLECTVYATAIFRQHALKILHKYLPLFKGTDKRAMLSQIVTDYVFLCPSRKSAREAIQSGSAAWMYVFDHVVSDRRVWDGLNFCYDHVCHGAELPFLFSSATVANFTLSPAEKLLANRMLCSWGTFAQAGDPSTLSVQSAFCHQQRLPPWPQYSGDSNWLVMNFTVRSHPQASPRDPICDFWDTLGIY